MDDPVITTREAAELLGVSIRTARSWVENGALDSWKTPGGHRRVKRSVVLALLEQVQPANLESSALVIVLASCARLPLYRAALGKVPECRVDTYNNTFAATLAIGGMSPAVIVMELDEEPAERFAMLRLFASAAALGHTQVLVLSAQSRQDVVEQARLDTRLEVIAFAQAVDELPARIRALICPPPLSHARSARVPSPARPPYPVLLNEAERVAAVERTGLVGTPPEDDFDRLTWLASQFFDMPIAVISLLAATRQWFKSHHGVEATGTPREWAFCNYTVLQREPFVVEDATLDPRFATNPPVAGSTRLRFYAGAPLIGADGFALGALCVVDRKPRKLDLLQLKPLSALASIAVDEIALRTRDRQLQWARAELNHRRRTGIS
jgi:excisionase family DNA binding protein